jgi:hypothetical protein
MGAWRSLSSKRFGGRRGDAASPDEIKQNAVAMMDDELVEMLLETVRHKTAELSPEQALKAAREILEW